MALTEGEIGLVQGSWEQVKTVAKLRVHGANFFELLFIERPEWRQKYFGFFGDSPVEDLKKDPKFQAHAGNVMSTLNFWVNNIDDLPLVAAAVAKIGKTHAGRGIYSAEFESIGAVILNYLRAGLGNAFTKDVEAAWTKLLATVVSVIKLGEK